MSLTPTALPRSGLTYLTIFAVFLMGGCATLRPDKCEQFDQTRSATDYGTVYSYSKTETRRAEQNFASRPRRNGVVARWYTLRLNRTRTRPCEHLYLIKDLYLQRSAGAITLEEKREFFTAKGQLIAAKRENITDQLSKSGFYTASVPLPIPRNAPTGTYRVVSHLIAILPKGRPQTLATAAAEFHVQQ